MTDIAALFAEQPIIDESTLPDAQQEGTNEAPGEEQPFSLDLGTQEAPEQHQERQKVPLAALQEERARRQEYKEQLEQERQHRQQMETRFQQMLERLQAQQAAQQQPVQEEQIPDFHDDPAGHVAALQQRYEREMNEYRQFREQVERQNQLQAHQYNLTQRVVQAENAFRASAPDYDAAAQHYIAVKQAEYRAYGLDDMAVANQLRNDMAAVANLAFQQGRNPAEYIYNAAKAAGFTGQPAQQKPAAPIPPRAPNGQFQKAPVPTSLATTPAVPAAPDEDGKLTLEKIAAMSEAEFDKLWKQMERGSVVMPKV